MPVDVRPDNCIKTGYRMNYIFWLKKNFERHDGSTYESIPDKLTERIIPCKSCYHDILYRMVFNLTDDYIRKYFFSTEGDEIWKKMISIEREQNGYDRGMCWAYEDFNESLEWIDAKKRPYSLAFSNEIKDIFLSNILERTGLNKEQWYSHVRNNTVDCIDADDETKELIGRFLEYAEASDILMEYCLMADPEAEYYRRKPEGASDYPFDWFSYEEIKAFIEKNFAPAQTEEEKRIDQLLSEVNKEDSDTLAYYYRFPGEWEKNGLADLVRNNCGLLSKEKTD